MPTPLISQKALDLIVEFEVSSQSNYEKHLSRPTWPGEASGVTIGIGFDLGYYSSDEVLHYWQQLGQRMVHSICSVVGIKGERTKGYLSKVQDVVVPWSMAEHVFNSTTIPKFYQHTKSVYPGLDDLHPDARGALVSLVFNRGTSMSGPRRVQMRNIFILVQHKDYQGIADQIRAMIPIWKGSSIYEGMANRRNAEADLIEQAA